MSFLRQKRLWLGGLAFLAPIPLPLSEVLSWPVLILYLAVVGSFLGFAWRDRGPWLGTLGMNLLGALYIPLLVLELQTLSSGLLRPVLHLSLFVIAVKLFALRQERDKWHSLSGIFFLFLASMGTAVHPSILLYMLFFLAGAVVVLSRFAYYSILTSFGQQQPLTMPVRGPAIAAVLGSLIIAVPLFALLPRVNSPFLVARGRGTGTVVHASGFTDVVTLDAIGTRRVNREVVLRLQSPGERLSEEDLRIKAATYERYDGQTWQRGNRGRRVFTTAGGSVQLVDVPVVRQAHVWLQPIGSATVPLPLRAASVRGPGGLSVERDAGGAVRLPFAPANQIDYEVGLADRPVLLSDPEQPPPEAPRPEDSSGITLRMVELAGEVLGEGADEVRIDRLERYLASQYTYAEDYLGRAGADPIDSFLFDFRRGHCEFFATAMVLLLRSQQIPARLVTGFLGGEFNRLEGYYAVRQLNAHAWVEAYSPAAGWQTYDPTPPAGRPLSARQNVWSLGAQAYDYLIFRWERYVLTFGVEDQVQILVRLKHLWQDLWRKLTGPASPPPPTVPDILPAPDPTVGDRGAPRSSPWLWGASTLVAIVLAGAVGWEWRARRPISGVEAYRHLRRRLRRAGLSLTDATAPRELEQAVLHRFPAASGPLREVVGRYLVESFAGEGPSQQASSALKAALSELHRRLPRASWRPPFRRGSAPVIRG